MSGPVIVAGVRPALTVEQQLLAACRAARDVIATDRQAFADCNVLPDGTFGADDAAVLADYDQALAQLDAAITRARPDRGSVWPFPPADPDERERIAREHRRQQRAAIVNGPEALL